MSTHLKVINCCPTCADSGGLVLLGGRVQLCPVCGGSGRVVATDQKGAGVDDDPTPVLSVVKS